MEKDLSYLIIGAAIEVQRALGGPGLLESIYEEALCLELSSKGYNIKRQVEIPVIYKGFKIKDPMYVDIVVENKLIIEVKATEKNHTIYDSQLLTYLRLTGINIGLVINFGYCPLKDGISRVMSRFDFNKA